MPRIAWDSPWEHDPVQRDGRQYMHEHPDDDTSSDDDDNHSSDDSDGHDSNDRGSVLISSSEDSSSEDNDNDDGSGVRALIDEADEVQFSHAVSLLAQANGSHNTFITIPGDPPTMISKNTAVIKLRDAFKDAGMISASRLQRITQLASSAAQQVDDCGEMVGEKFELHDTLAFAVQQGGRYSIKFGRVKK